MKQLPAEVRIREVGPRDGFQNEPETISTADKVRLIDLLSATGLRRIEVTSFVRPDVIPQLSDAAEVLAAVQRREGVSFSVLIPNERGLERALEMRERFDEVSVFLSASETHNRHNVNRSVEDSLAGLEATLARAGEAGLRREGVIATSFGCPYEGPGRARAGARDRRAAGRRRLRGGRLRRHHRDGQPAPGPRVLRRRPRAPRRAVELTAHFHNTRGQGLANVLAALEEGIESFESSFGELGGCPVPPGSTGNVSSEDVVSMLHEMGVETGVDLPRLIEASARPRRCWDARSAPTSCAPARSTGRRRLSGRAMLRRPA